MKSKNLVKLDCHIKHRYNTSPMMTSANNSISSLTFNSQVNIPINIIIILILIILCYSTRVSKPLENICNYRRQIACWLHIKSK